ncbi:hypothetical protein BGW38_008837 [Lunasporangiospora selenospora]|uniref:Uncharacterized protein n=1 Tax=Lunasporangiospora selenospora TaxID=979761 RepID=A0A9P6FK80_9FUNG|nr:hypothetical protein BGW38_008837 [Lunasporangiospora selenospora]
MRCGRSHDLDLILDAEEEERDSKKRKRRKTAETEVAAPPPTLESEPHKVDSQVQTVQPVSESLQTTATTSTTATAVAPEPSETRAIERSLPELSVTESGRLPSEKFHSAYFDAFMTGTIFAHQMNIHSRSLIEIQARNKIYLIGKSFPLKIEKSVFSKFSPSHERQRVL